LKYLRHRSWLEAPSDEDDSFRRVHPPSFQDLIADVAATMRKCQSRDLLNLPELYSYVGGRPDSSPSCYVNPFTLNSAYSLFLPRWLSEFPAAVLVLPYELLQVEAAILMRKVSAHLGLAPYRFDTSKAFNTRANRGVHSAPRDGDSRIPGGVASSIRVEKGLLSRRSGQLTPQEQCTLALFFEPFTRDLRRLLAEHRQAEMPWSREAELLSARKRCADSTGGIDWVGTFVGRAAHL